MGLFDDIRCEYPLPLPEDQGELVGRDWSREGFQTKDLGQGMGGYCIRADGTLWLVKGRWLEDDPPSEVFQEAFFGSVAFYHTVYGRKRDYRVEWQASFAQGKIKDLRLSEWQVLDNTERLRQEAEMAASAARRDRFLKTWVGRFVYPAYAWVVGLFLNNVLAGGADLLSRGCERVRTGAWRLESKLAPHGNPIAQRARVRRLKADFSQGPGDFRKRSSIDAPE